ncbi:CD225/dispanin family protein [Mycobacterium avium]|uniref:CD225/dispanin family protein n=1 Tax=Mycobacterium avium TaxID=1764 RepID=UPI002F26AB3B
MSAYTMRRLPQPGQSTPSSALVGHTGSGPPGVVGSPAQTAAHSTVAIVKSSQVNGLWAQGRYAEAQASADSAKKWVIWSAVIGVVVGIIYGILMAVGALNTNTNAALAAMF